jgi:hypothetical protein
MTDQLDLEVFRAGDYGDKGVWGETQLDQIAADYDPQTHEAPVTLDHAQHGPALGWVATVRRVGDRLVARLRGVSARLLDLIHAGAFKKRSVELYPRLRATGRPYLRAVSFLGAAVPEVKGLADPLPPVLSESKGAPLFAEDDAAISVTDTSPLRLDLPEVAVPVPSNSSAPSDPSDRSDLSDSSNASEPSHSSHTSHSSHSSHSFDDLVQRLRSSGRWHPAWADLGIAEFYQALSKLGAIEFTESQTIDPACWFAEFLSALPPVVVMEETCGHTIGYLDARGDLGTLGARVDPASLDLHRAALAFQESHPGVAYSEALTRCATRR